MKSLAELCEADQRTLMFGPFGVGTHMNPEAAAESLQRVMARYELVSAVAESTRQSFDQLRTTFIYGLFCYDVFTLVTDRALLVFEQALRDRFIEFHHGTVTFVDPGTRQAHRVDADRYEQVQEFTSRHRDRALHLQVGDGPQTIPFNGMLKGLRNWARHTGLLRGQRNRAVETAISNLRNFAAHPSAYHLTTPADAANTLSDLAEIINHLWGAATPGGRLYPAPLRRTIIALSWNTATAEIMSAPVAPSPRSGPQEHDTCLHGDDGTGGSADDARDGWQHVLVRAVANDWDLKYFDARYDAGRYPVEWLWGPGTAEGLSAWLDREQPGDDEVDVLDRLFLLRFHDDLLYLPRNPIQAASVAEDEKPGTWYVLKADSPILAFNHQRQVLAGGFGCSRNGDRRHRQRDRQRARPNARTRWSSNQAVNTRVRNLPDARIPLRMGWPRCNKIMNGCWEIPQHERFVSSA